MTPEQGEKILNLQNQLMKKQKEANNTMKELIGSMALKRFWPEAVFPVGGLIHTSYKSCYIIHKDAKGKTLKTDFADLPPELKDGPTMRKAIKKAMECGWLVDSPHYPVSPDESYRREKAFDLGIPYKPIKRRI